MIKVLHLLYMPNIGEFEKNTQILIQYTDKQQFDVTLCFLHQHGPMVDICRNNGIKTIVIGMKNGLDFIGAIRFWKFIKKEQFDIIHIQTPNVLTFAMSFFTAPHVICHISWAKAWERKGLRKFILRFFLNRINYIITSCDHVKKAIQNNYGILPHQIQTVYNGINLKRYTSTPSYKQNLLSSLNIIDNNAFVIGFIAKLIPTKGCHKLLHATQDIITSDRHCHIVIVGDGPERAGLELLAKELDISTNVIFVGESDTETNYFSIFDIFVLPSDVESFPRSIEQAFASGIPTIACNVGGISEIIQDGIDGFLVNPGICDELKEKILYLKHNKDVRTAMSHAAQKRSQNFDIYKKTRQIEQLYKNIMRENIDS